MGRMIQRIPTRVVQHVERSRNETVQSLSKRKKFRLFNHQALMMASFSRIILLTAGLGAGKTFSLVWWAFNVAFINHPYRVALFEPTFPMVRSILVPTAEMVAEMAGMPCKWVQSNREFKVKFNGIWLTLTFGGASNPDHVKGQNLAAAGTDETGQMKKDVVKHIAKRVRLGEAPLLQIAEAGTPEGMSGSFYEQAEGTTELYRRRLAVGYTQRIKACSYDNDTLDETYLREELAEFTPEEQEAYIFGEFVPQSGRAYPQFRAPPPGAQIGGHVQDLGPYKGGQLILGADFNVSPMCWILGVVHYRKNGKNIHWFKEYQYDNAVTFEVAREVAADLKAMLSTETIYDAARRVQVYCDASGQNRSTTSWETNVQHLRSAGFEVWLEEHEGNPPIADRQNTVNYAFHKDRMSFHPRCTNAIASFIGQGRDKNGLPDKSKGLDHFPDGVGYAAWKIYPKPKPRGNVHTPRRYR